MNRFLPSYAAMERAKVPKFPVPLSSFFPGSSLAARHIPCQFCYARTTRLAASILQYNVHPLLHPLFAKRGFEISLTDTSMPWYYAFKQSSATSPTSGPKRVHYMLQSAECSYMCIVQEKLA